MQDRNESPVRMDELESRTLLSGGGHFHGHGGGRHLHIPTPPSAAVQADLDKITADQQKLDADRVTQAPILVTDRQAIKAAITALDAQLTPLKQTLATDTATLRQTLDTDWQAIRADRTSGDTAQLAIDKAKYKTDRQAGRTTLKADAQAISDLITNDPGVIAAKAQLKTDQQILDDDRATLVADNKQLRLDIKAQRDGTA